MARLVPTHLPFCDHHPTSFIRPHGLNNTYKKIKNQNGHSFRLAKLLISTTTIVVRHHDVGHRFLVANKCRVHGNKRQTHAIFQVHERIIGVAQKENGMKLSSRNGMLFFYTPAFLIGLTSFFVFPDQDLRFLLLSSALTVHFLKRVLEVLFVHKFSGSMTLESAIIVTLSYAFSTATMIYAQYLSRDIPEPAMDLKYIGIGLFLIGITGNFYHHYILANLRKEGEKDYKIPQGGLFDLVICPHYLFEIFGYVGISCISQTPYAFAFTLGTIFYLTGRSCATREWYISKFGDKFPKDVKAFIPYIL